MKPLAVHVSAFLHEHLPRDKGASPHTLAAYAQALKLLVCFAAARTRRRPSQLALEQIDADLVLAFLEHIEREGASARTRNMRLAAIKTFFRAVEWREPAALEQVRRIGLIPRKRTDTPLVAWLTHAEIRALLNAPDTRRRDGVRDRAMLHMAYACGLRVSELTGLAVSDEPGEIEWTREGEILRCPWHGWEFDILNGRTIFESKARVKTYDVRVEKEALERLKDGVETFPVRVEDEVVILEY